MRYRLFGRTDWEVSEIGYGMWGMGGWTGSDDEESAGGGGGGGGGGGRGGGRGRGQRGGGRGAGGDATSSIPRGRMATGTASGCSAACSGVIRTSACTPRRKCRRRTSVGR